MLDNEMGRVEVVLGLVTSGCVPKSCVCVPVIIAVRLINTNHRHPVMAECSWL